MMLLELFKELSLHPKNATELKALILQLAVQGKLTAKWREENPDVEPASELLKRVVRKIDRKIKNREENLRKDIFVTKEIIPEKWLLCKLGEAIILISGRDLTPKEYSDNVLKYPYLTGASQIKENEIILSRWTNTPKVISKKGDLLISCKGTIGKTVINKIGDLHIARQIMAIRTDDNIAIEFIKIFIDSYVRSLQELSKSMIPGISRDDVLEANLFLPPIQEQHAIVTIVNQLFTEVEQLEQLTKERIQLKHDFATSALQRLVLAGNINGEWAAVQQQFHTFFNEKPNVKKLRETILQLAVQGKLTTHWRRENPDTEPATELLKRISAEKQELIQSGKIKKEKPLPPIKEDEIPFELPEGWVWCRLGEIIVFLNGFAFKSNTYVSNSKYQVIRLGNVKNDRLLINSKEAFVPEQIGEEAIEYQLVELDIVTTLTGTKGKRDYCYTCIVKSNHLKDRILLLNQRVGCIRSINKNLTELINMFLKTEPLQMQLFATETGTANQGNIGSTAYKNLIFPIPPLKEQHAIVTTVNTLMGLCDALEQELGRQESRVEELMRSCVREVVEYRADESEHLPMAAEERVGYDAKK